MSPSTLVSTGVVVLLCALIVAARAAQADRDSDRVVLDLAFPREVGLTTPLAFMRAAHEQSGSLLSRSSIVFETLAEPSSIRYRLVVPRKAADRLTGALAATVPGAAWTFAAADSVRWSGSLSIRIAAPEARLQTRDQAALVSAQLASLLPLETAERLVVQFTAWGGAGASPSEGGTGPGWWGQLPSVLARPPRQPHSSGRPRRGGTEPMYRVVIRIGVVAESAGRRRHLLRRAFAGLTVVRVPGTSFEIRPVLSAVALRALQCRATPLWSLGTSLLDGGELAVLTGWPVTGVNAPAVTRLRSRRLPVPDAVPKTGRIVGEDPADAARTVGQDRTDITRHTWVLGATGTGKSTLLANMITGDIREADRRAVIVIEPKGDLIRDVLTQVPEAARSRLVVLDPADPDWTVGLNPFAASHMRDRDLAVDRVYAVLHAFFADNWGPRLGDLLHAGLVSLANDPALTLAELPSVFTDPAFRSRLLRRLRPEDWAIRPVWAAFDDLSHGEQLAMAASVTNKLRSWTTRSRIRQLLGVVEPKWSFDSLLRDGGVLLVSLGAGTLGAETASLIGALLISMLWSAISARTAVPEGQRRLAAVYLDEWQSFVRLGDLGEALALARGLGAGLVLANQSPQQIPPALRSVAVSQTRTKIVLNLSADDAGALARDLGEPVRPEDITGLDRYTAIVKLLVDNETVAPFSLRTRPLPPPLAPADEARAASMERYGFRRDAVEEAIRARLASDDPERDIGRRRRT